MCLVAAFLLLLALLPVPATAQTDPRAAMLESAGWAALQAGDARAAAAFRAALVSNPRNARLHLGAGTAAFLEQRDADATAALERALELDERLTDARVLLGRVRYRAGDLFGAIQVYERVVADDPADARSRETLERWHRELELHNRLRQSLNERFTVSFEGPAEETLAASVLESLDKAYWRVGDALTVFPVSPISVVLYTTEQFRDITRSPPWAAGAYDGTIRVPMRGALNNAKELDRVLAHEYVHALVRTLASRNVPTWLNEGLATALETDNLDWAHAHVPAGAALMPLNELRNSFGRLTGEQAQLAYATSALAVQQLLDEGGGFGVANLLRDLGEGVDSDAALAHRMPRCFADWTAAR